MKKLIICGHKFQYFDHYFYFKYMIENNIIKKNDKPYIVARYWRGEKYGLPPIRVSEIYKTDFFKNILKQFLNMETIDYDFIWIDKNMGLKPVDQIINTLNNNNIVILFLKQNDIYKTNIYNVIKKANISNITTLKFNNNISHNHWNFNNNISEKNFKENLFSKLF